MIEIAAMPPIMDVDIQQKLAKIDVATLGHGDGYRFAHRSIQGLNKNHHIVGRAVTVFLVGRDSGVLHHAIGLCRPCDVLVIQAGDDVHACLGGGVGFAAKTQGIAGAVIDGPATDILELEQHDFPVWCRGVSPLTTQSKGQDGAMNVPINIGGVAVYAGDIVVADCSGVVFLKPEQAESSADWALEKISRGDKNRKAVKNGAKFGEVTGASERVLQNLIHK